ncbi:MAG: pyrimidine 5'-nucleotidase [Anaerolineae bacterium]|jgi:putative hydrolase of the HAD superfamily
MTLTHILFDLDETLYPRQAGLLDAVNRRITLWLQRTYRLSPEAALALRKRYFAEHGTTLSGLVVERQIDVDAYLEFVHDVPVARYLDPNPALAAMLDDIPLRKAVFTNAPLAYGARVLERLGVIDRFEHLVGIREMGLCSKPQPEAYRRLLMLVDAEPEACILVEDRAQNLPPAKNLGMTTILVDAVPHGDVDFVVSDVLEVGPLVASLLDGRGAGDATSGAGDR